MKINPKQLERMMRQMGMSMANIDAEEVIIRTPDKDIIIKNPQVSKVNIMGKETFQITGDVSEKPRSEFTDEDIERVAEQAGVSFEEAKQTLTQTKDIAEAIMKLKDK